MEKPKIIAYLKPTCGWSNGVRAVFRKYDLPFEDRDRSEEHTSELQSRCVPL
jgi:hypothetical protein